MHPDRTQQNQVELRFHCQQACECWQAIVQPVYLLMTVKAGPPAKCSLRFDCSHLPAHVCQPVGITTGARSNVAGAPRRLRQIGKPAGVQLLRWDRPIAIEEKVAVVGVVRHTDVVS